MEQSIERENIEQFAAYFKEGCKEKNIGSIGLEVEHFVVNQESVPVSYEGERGIEQLLERLAVHFDRMERSDGHLIGLARADCMISIEPAAQLEVSLTADENLTVLKSGYERFLEEIRPVLEEWNYHLQYAGYRTKGRAQDAVLIPKKRYACMDAYFSNISSYGTCMMRGTASVQTAVDYCSEEDFVRTYRFAVAIGPLLALLTDNADIFEEKPWTKHMVRTYIWERVDKERCNVVPGTFDASFGFTAYAQYLYHVPTIFQEEDGKTVPTAKSLSEICGQKRMTRQQLEHAVSIVFPDVRLKQYLEIRVADSMPPEYIYAYVAWTKGLFADREKLYQLYEKFEQYIPQGRMSEKAVEEGKCSLMEHGYDGVIYGRRAYEWLEDMKRLVIEQLSEQDCGYAKPLFQAVEQRCSVRNR